MLAQNQKMLLNGLVNLFTKHSDVSEASVFQ